MHIKKKRLKLIIFTACLAAILPGLIGSLFAFQQDQAMYLQNYRPPATLSLCGEPVPLTDQYAREMLDREFTISVWDRAQVFMWLKRSTRYFPVIEKKLAEADMPDDLKYLAVAESSLIKHIPSRKGALGIWQFMPATGRINGLRKDHMVDERLNPDTSTDAALKHLKKLKEQFGSWTLAMAAYNCGKSRLKKEIEEQKTNNYYRLKLPVETERYIFRIAAIKIIMENHELYGYRLDPDDMYPPVRTDTVKVKLALPIHITEIAENSGTDFKTIKELNPEFLGYYIPSGTYSLRVPEGMGDRVKIVINDLNKKALAHMKRNPESYYTVKYGETLGHIALRTGTPVSRIKQLNAIKGSLILAGQKLRLTP